MPHLALLSIPAYYILLGYPHVHALFNIAGSTFKYRDNANPHGEKNTAMLKKHLNARQFAAYERAERCHRNGLESIPLFIAAIFAGFLAEQKAGRGAVGLSTFAACGLLSRTGYTISYLLIESNEWSAVRSLFYNLELWWALVVIVRAAFKLG